MNSGLNRSSNLETTSFTDLFFSYEKNKPVMPSYELSPNRPSPIFLLKTERHFYPLSATEYTIRYTPVPYTERKINSLLNIIYEFTGSQTMLNNSKHRERKSYEIKSFQNICIADIKNLCSFNWLV